MMENRLFRALAGVMAVAAVAYGWWLRTNGKGRSSADPSTGSADPIAA